MEPEEQIEERIWASEHLRWYAGYVLLWLGTWLFVRWGARLLRFEKPTTGPTLFRALIISEQVDQYGIEGLAMIKGFHDAYLVEER
jgi:hypothetical protein